MNTRNRIRAAAIAVGGLFGLAAGVGGYTFIYAAGGSYLTNDPKACANFHVMPAHLDAWLRRRPLERRMSNLRPRATSSAKRSSNLDFIEAENSKEFNAPQEAARSLGESIDFTSAGKGNSENDKSAIMLLPLNSQPFVKRLFEKDHGTMTTLPLKPEYLA